MTEASDAEGNWRRFVIFRVLFNARFYYPVLAIFFLDLGLTATQYTLLNFAWALAIVVVDLPSGALADRIGRKPLIVGAAVLMIFEMLLLCVAPRNGGMALFLICLANRILSGTAEGMASGADEALVFDSLKEPGRASQWPRVLEQVMRWQGAGMVAAMLIGGLVYDPAFMSSLCRALGVAWRFDQPATLRFPIYLNLVTAVLALVVVSGFRESWNPEKDSDSRVSPGGEDHPWRLVKTAAVWIYNAPLVRFVILAGLLMDSSGRLFMTFASSYFRLINLPEGAYGLISSGMGLMGFLIAPAARRLAQRLPMGLNFLVVGVVTVVGLGGLALRWRIWGALFLIPICAAMSLLGYFVSFYLNQLADSRHRATVLSFKGVAFNLSYGFVSLLFACALRAARAGASPAEAFSHALAWLPVWLIATLLILAISFRRHYSRLMEASQLGRSA